MLTRRLLRGLVVGLCLLALLGGSVHGKAEAKAEAEASTVGASPKEHSFRGGSEKFEFQAEVNRLMDILINSLYSNKDIFLRELISNAADALDKIRLLSLTDKSQLGDKEDLEIRISLDHDKSVLTIRDTGVGMTKQDLISNLGTIAKSGTSAFLETMQKGGDVNLIGQFGVGFYSVYLVADYVEVTSKHNDDRQWVWESKADGNFAVSEDEEGEPLGRGTRIVIHLKEETQEYAAEAKLKELVQKYSEFVNFPIYLYESKRVDVPAEEAEDATEEDEETAAEDDEISDEEEEDEPEEPAKPKTVSKTVWDWQLLNDNKPIWLRPASEVTEEEYANFFKALSKTTQDPLAHVHFKGEGDVEFRSILFIPAVAPIGMLDNYYSKTKGLDLYVRRVFITNELEELIPRYLGFLSGLVDSDTLPLSVSREALQEHAALKVIKKKVVRKTLDTLKQLAEADKEAKGDGDGKPAEKEGQYAKFWREFGKMIKLGIMEDGSNRQRLARLLRFHTSKSPTELTSLEEYIERMQPKQKHIYFMIGETQEEVARSSFLEKLFDRDYEVIYFTDSVDEYVMQHLTEFEDRKCQNAAKENLKLGDKDEKEKKKEKALREEFKPVVQWWKEQLGQGVSSVKVSRRLAKSPAIVVSGQFGWSANMERIMRAQAVSESQGMGRSAQKILEINPRHPLVQEIKAKYEANKDDPEAISIAKIIYESALLESGFTLDNPKAYNERIHTLLARTLNVPVDAVKGVDFDRSLEHDEDAEDDALSGENNEELIDRLVKEHAVKQNVEKAEL